MVQKVMKEIRLCWSVIGRENIVGEEIQNGLWHPDTPDVRRDLELIRDAGNETYGPGTHWIEEREA
jgi:hypothetical protein